MKTSQKSSFSFPSQILLEDAIQKRRKLSEQSVCSATTELVPHFINQLTQHDILHSQHFTSFSEKNSFMLNQIQQQTPQIFNFQIPFQIYTSPLSSASSSIGISSINIDQIYPLLERSILSILPTLDQQIMIQLQQSFDLALTQNLHSPFKKGNGNISSFPSDFLIRNYYQQNNDEKEKYSKTLDQLHSAGLAQLFQNCNLQFYFPFGISSKVPLQQLLLLNQCKEQQSISILRQQQEQHNFSDQPYIRKIKVQKYLQKKKDKRERNMKQPQEQQKQEQVRYVIRKHLAENRKREQGRFIKQSQPRFNIDLKFHSGQLSILNQTILKQEQIE